MSVIERYAVAWEHGDLATMVDCYADDVVAHYGGRSRYAGDHIGRDAFQEVLAESAALAQRELVSIDQRHDDGSIGALFVTERISVDGTDHLVQRALRYRLADDRIAECWLFDHDQHLVDAAWTPPPIG